MPSLITPCIPAGSIAKTGQPTLTADELVLRPWAEDDADVLLAAFEDPAIRQWHARSVDDRDEALEMIAGYNRSWHAERDAQWLVTDAADGTPLARVAIRTMDLLEGNAFIGYWALPSSRGRGVTSRAAARATDWALNEAGFHRIVLHHAVANKPSCRVAEKAGYEYEGTERSSALHADGWHDMHRHIRIRGE